jgi:sulfur-oxidizing protein SoxA
MKPFLNACFISAVVASSLGFAGPASADPEGDRTAFRDFYAERFADVPLSEHKNGVYAIDQGAREQWLELEDFPPYEIALDEGIELYEQSFADGANYSDCFGEGRVRQNYPRFDREQASVETLDMAINACRVSHDEPALAYDSHELAALSSFIAFASRGEIVNVATPTTAAELEAYEEGKRFYQSRRGQLNFSCSSCHVQIVGNRLRAERLSASLGHVTHWPVYRLKWQEMGGLHLRFQECNSQVGAEPFELQSQVYRNLEYFLSYMSNGLEWNGPGTRK